MDYIYDILIKEREALKTKLNQVNEAIEQYGKGGSSVSNPILSTEETATVYANTSHVLKREANTKDVSKFTVNQKLLYALKENKRFMKIREMAQFVVAITGESEDELVKQMSRRTGNLKKLKKIAKYQLGASLLNVFWGSPNWLNEDGSIKKGYEYDESSTKASVSESLFDIE